MTCDKTAGFDRLTPGINRYGNHVHIDLGELVDLPGGLDGEMDVEGLHLDGDWFWVAGCRSSAANRTPRSRPARTWPPWPRSNGTRTARSSPESH